MQPARVTVVAALLWRNSSSRQSRNVAGIRHSEKRRDFVSTVSQPQKTSTPKIISASVPFYVDNPSVHHKSKVWKFMKSDKKKNLPASSCILRSSLRCCLNYCVFLGNSSPPVQDKWMLFFSFCCCYCRWNHFYVALQVGPAASCFDLPSWTMVDCRASCQIYNVGSVPKADLFTPPPKKCIKLILRRRCRSFTKKNNNFFLHHILIVLPSREWTWAVSVRYVSIESAVKVLMGRSEMDYRLRVNETEVITVAP